MNTTPEQRNAADLHRELQSIWANWRGLGVLAAVNHSTIGMRFIITGFVFMLIGGMLAMFIRLQIAWSGNQVLEPETYNQLVTMHGTTMMFLFAVPIVEGFALYLIPKMIGARDVPFPRLTAFGYWCYLFGGLILYSSFLFGAAPDTGWFMYTPLTGKEFTPGISADFWLLGVTLAEVSAVAAAIELVVAILCTRAPGMAIQRMPLFAWYILAMALMIAFGFPPLIMGSVLLEIERAFGFVFFDADRGGDPLLWQHLFWLFGHPEVYIVFLPAAGIVTTLIPTFAQRPIVGYSWVVLAIIGTAFLSFGLWVHHMFTVGIPYLSLSFFSAASMAVAIPMGIQVFVWIATLWSGQPRFQAPMLFIAGFFFVFVLGGLTGVMVALVPFDWQVHDSHFVVAHLHYVLIGGVLFPLFAAFYYWLPLWTGRMPSMSLAKMSFWLIFIGFNVTFFPMHLTGLLGMPRRVYTYSSDLGIDMLNLVSTIGGFVLAFGTVAFVIELLLARRHGRRCEHCNPWQAGTLEWAVPMPVPNYNFASLPLIVDRDPLWRDAQLSERLAAGEGYLGFARDGARETLGTAPLTGKPEQLIRLSLSSWWPLATAVATATAFIGVLSQLYALALAGLGLTVLFGFASLWSTGDRHAPPRLEVGRGLSLPIQYAARNAPGWWGMIILLLVDVALFTSLLYGYFYLWLGADQWPAPGYVLAELPLPLLAAAALAASALVMLWALRANRADARRQFHLAIALVVLLGILAIAAMLGSSAVFAPVERDGYGSVSMAVLGYAWLHAGLGVLIALYAGLRSLRGYLDAARPLEARIACAFWQTTVAIGLIALAVVHGFPRFG